MWGSAPVLDRVGNSGSPSELKLRRESSHGPPLWKHFSPSNLSVRIHSPSRYFTLANVRALVGNEPVPIRHLDLRQALRINDRIFGDDLILEQEPGDD